MIDDVSRHEFRVWACTALPAESDDGLRNIDIDHDALAETGRRGIRYRLEIVLGGQCTESAADHPASCFGLDSADDLYLQFVAREHAAHVFAQIGRSDTRYRFKSAFAFAAVGMIGESGLPPAAAGEVSGIGRITLKRGHGLPADPVDRIRIKARVRQRKA